MTATFVPLQIKMRATGPGQQPGSPATLLPGELAYNANDNTVYIGHDVGGANGTALTVLALAGSGAFVGLTGNQTIADVKTFSGPCAFTGTGSNSAVGVTQSSADDSTRLATTAYVKSVVSGAGGGSVTSVAFSGGTTGLTVTGSPITSSGTITLAGTLAVANGGTGITSFGTGIAAFLGTPSSANLAAAVTDETGTGSLVFSASPALTGTVSAENLTLSGNLTVNGTTTTINSTTVTIDDKNFTLGDVASPTDAGADGGGITLKGTTDKTLNWVDATDAWTSSEHLNLLTGKALHINGTSVLSSNTLGSGVTTSSLTSVGTIATGTWNGTAISVVYGGTGLTTAPQGTVLVANTANTITALGSSTTNKILAYNATSNTVEWITGINGGTY